MFDQACDVLYCGRWGENLSTIVTIVTVSEITRRCVRTHRVCHKFSDDTGSGSGEQNNHCFENTHRKTINWDCDESEVSEEQKTSSMWNSVKIIR